MQEEGFGASYDQEHPQYYSLPPALTESQLEEAKVEVTKQIEYFFSVNELCRNTYLRHHMDVQGYLPAAIVFNFPSVVMHGVPYHDLMDHLNTNSTSIDVDIVNETMRVSVGWEQWLYPNGEGGLGCPRWIKQPQDDNGNDDDDNDNDNSSDEQQKQSQDQEEQPTSTDITREPTPELVHTTEDSETVTKQ